MLIKAKVLMELKINLIKKNIKPITLECSN